MFGKARIGVTISVLKYALDPALHNIPHVDKSDLVVGGTVIDVPLMYVPIRNHYLIHISIDAESQEYNMGNQDVDKDVPYILSDMLIQSQMLKDDDDHTLEDVEVGIVVTNDGGVINHDHPI